MADEKWQKVREIFDSALSKKPEERRNYVIKACDGNKTLFAEVESLLSSLNSAESFMEKPAIGRVAELVVDNQLEIGQEIGHYKIIEKIGKGGMGEVFLAEDTRLKRKIALKILPAAFSQDKNYLRRFEQEACAASALNHPNILTVHEFGEENGTVFIASEFVEGKTLRERLGGGKTLSLHETSDIALQVAAALHAAHETGIIHRDIKPENVMIREDGLVKVLDFGLAKLTLNKNEAIDLENETQINTAPGMIMGTVAYMSPEQTRGKETDARSDIWSFGVVLYEMLSGKPAFAKENNAETISAILNDEPDLTGIPIKLQPILRKSLMKNKTERYQTVKDLAKDLQEIQKNNEINSETATEFDEYRQTETVSTSPPGQVVSNESPQLKKQSPFFLQSSDPKVHTALQTEKIGNEQAAKTKIAWFNRKSLVYAWRSYPVLYSIFGILMIIFILTAGFFVWRGNGKNESSIRFDVPDNIGLKFEKVTSSDNSIAAAISPDGKYVAYINIANGQRSLWLRQLSTGVNVQIVAPVTGVIFHDIEFSGNGEYVYFTRVDQDGMTHLERVSILGGIVKTNILRGLDGAFSVSPDDRQISFRRMKNGQHYLLITDIDGNSEREIFETQQTISDNIFSPDGKKVAFASGQSGAGSQDFGVYTIEIESGEVKSATNFKWFYVRGIVWIPDQSGLLVTARIRADDPQQLWEISLPDGNVRKITNTQKSFNAISATTDLSQILLSQVSRSANLYLASASAPENMRTLAQASAGVVWTPENNLVYSSFANGNNDIWMMNADKTKQKQLTSEDSADFYPQSSPDGRYIVFVSDRKGKNNLWRMNADGSNLIQLTNGEGEKFHVFTADGQFVVFNSMKDGSLWKVPVEGGEVMQISEKRMYNISISPDGTKFAHFAKKDDKLKIVIKSFPGGDDLKEFGIPEGYSAERVIVWTKEGNDLIYAAEDIDLVGNLWRQSLNGNEPQQITNYTSNEIFYFDFSPDNSQIALIRGSWNHDVVLLKGFTK